MEKNKDTPALDVFSLGKTTFNFYHETLKATKKKFKNYLSIIESFVSSVENHKNSIEKINQEINKDSSNDSPFFFLQKFQVILKLHNNYIDLFLESISKTYNLMKTSITSVSSLIGNYLSNIQKLSMNLNNESITYFQHYDELIKSLEETEMIIISDYTKQKYKIAINNKTYKDKDKDDAIEDSRKCEEIFLESDSKIKGEVNQYMTEFNTNLKIIKKDMIKLNDDFKNDLLNLMITLKKNYNNFINLLYNDSLKIKNFDNNDTSKKEIEEYLNYEIKLDDSFEILKAIKRDKYIIKIIKENEKNAIENESNHKKYHITKNLAYTGTDIFNIAKIIYDYGFKTIDTDLYNLDIEKNKLKIVQYCTKFLNFNFDTNEYGKEGGFYNNAEEKYFNELLFSDERYIIKFLFCLNYFRTSGKYELKTEIFNLIKSAFCKIADYLIENDNKKISHFLIILSQTFYLMKDGKKYFLQKEIKNCEYFRDTKFWINDLEDIIKNEIDKFEDQTIKNNIVFSEDRKKKKIEEIVFSKMASIIASLNGFEFEKEKMDEILSPFITKYKLSDQSKNTINSLIQAK
jgi:hypothetical protein